MARFFPKSLVGQMLLAVAVALLVAQAITVVLLYRAEQNRREGALINDLAFQLVADPRIEYGEGGGDASARRRGGRGERRRLRIERALESPLVQGELRDPGREDALSQVLEGQGVEIDQLIVFSRPTSRDRYLRENRPRVPRFSRQRFDPEGEIVLAGLKRSGADEWLVARAPKPPRSRGALAGLILQTLILYAVLVGGLAWLLRRLTRPLAKLTSRVERFGGALSSEPPLEPSGPDDARRLIAAHNAMEARITALLDEKNVMLGAIGHDLKTPLAALRVRIENVDDEAEREKMATSIEDITSSLDDILSLARVGRPSDPLEKTDLAALVTSVVEEYEDMDKPVEPGEIERVAMPVRATWLRRAIRNLVDNGLRYGDRVSISLARESSGNSTEEAVIRIADSGPGIPDAEIETMLQPFKRGEASRNRETGGAGLGLTLARAIAEQHGGTLSLANRIGLDGKPEGLVAEIRLPVG